MHSIRFDVLTLFPQIFPSYLGESLLSKAIDNQLVEVHTHDIREWTRDKHHKVDAKPFGGGPGMLIQVQPVVECVEAVRAMCSDPGQLILLSPQGETLKQSLVAEFSQCRRLLLLCGRYEGVDERLLAAEVDEHLSIGDYVLTGGELPALVVMDAVSRHLPGTLGNSASAMEESHLDGLLDYPHYTRPENSARGVVPPVLMSGDHAVVQRFRKREALKRTWMHRPDLLSSRPLTEVETTLLTELFESELRSGAEFSN